jgi:hypothetical protein
MDRPRQRQQPVNSFFRDHIPEKRFLNLGHPSRGELGKPIQSIPWLKTSASLCVLCDKILFAFFAPFRG